MADAAQDREVSVHDFGTNALIEALWLRGDLVLAAKELVRRRLRLDSAHSEYRSEHPLVRHQGKFQTLRGFVEECDVGVSLVSREEAAAALDVLEVAFSLERPTKRTATLMAQGHAGYVLDWLRQTEAPSNIIRLQEAVAEQLGGYLEPVARLGWGAHGR